MRTMTFGFALTVDAERGVRKRIEASHGDRHATTFASTVLTLAHPLQGVFDTGQLAAFYFRQLRTDLVLGRIQSRVDDVASGLGPQFLQQTQVSRQCGA